MTNCLALESDKCPELDKVNELYAQTWPLHCPHLSDLCSPFEYKECIDRARNNSANLDRVDDKVEFCG